MQKFDRDCNKLKKSNRAYPKIHRVLIRSGWSPVRVRVNERARVTIIIFITIAFSEVRTLVIPNAV